MTKQKTKTAWMTERNRLLLAGKEADSVVEQLGLTAPIDPLAIVRSEWPLLRAGGRDFGNRFDGKLEYHREKNCFLLFYNTKYDLTPGVHHPRTRFSIAHELGHYFLRTHQAYLRRVHRMHASRGEFLSDTVLEKEADSFAASVLLPTRIARPIINQGELSIDRICGIARQFDASVVSTALRCVALSDFPCAIGGIQGGRLAWTFPSHSLLNAGIYPGKHSLSSTASEAYVSFQNDEIDRLDREGRVADWFTTFDRAELDSVYLTEEYLYAQSMDTLLVLLTMDESDLFGDHEEDHDTDD